MVGDGRGPKDNVATRDTHPKLISNACHVDMTMSQLHSAFLKWGEFWSQSEPVSNARSGPTRVWVLVGHQRRSGQRLVTSANACQGAVVVAVAAA